MAGPYSLVGNYDQVNAGQMFASMLATPAAIPVSSTTAAISALWNPLGSTVKLVLQRISFGWMVTTETPGNIQLNCLFNTGGNVATGAPLTVFTAGVFGTAINNMKLGGGNQPQGRWATAATLTTAGVPIVTLGMNHLTTTGASTTVPGWVMDYYFYDGVILMPGTMVYPTASTATASTYHISMWWREVAVND